ncbi:ABC transporter permease [Polynucleobacter sp. 31A-FELB]|uniref:ABC transporter permease n=1 Tax=Polynucleobacter sp. 31A-FELB TaxID=2689096 RepID=UPI001C0B84C3|nr:ABC transporter permease [Polynucleobacter sp. 31A-FELB]MBU3588099.1 ABC transporter permease [Polynucleobacter sp. 31A-FELB]
MSTSFSRLWAYRGFIVSSVKREFQLRYQNSILGASWTILNPLAMMLVYTLIFSQVMQARLPGADTPYAYSIFLISGLLPWGLLTDIVSRGPTLFLDQANLLKKIHFPKIALLVIAVANSLINFGIIFGLFLLFLLLSGQFPGWIILWVLPILLLQICFAASLCLILAILNVFFRDVAPLTNIALQFGFWLTPILYAQSMVPAQYQQYLALNPLSHIFESYHAIFLAHEAPNWGALLAPVILCGILIVIATRLFNKHAAEMVDEL